MQGHPSGGSSTSRLPSCLRTLSALRLLCFWFCRSGSGSVSVSRLPDTTRVGCSSSRLVGRNRLFSSYTLAVVNVVRSLPHCLHRHSSSGRVSLANKEPSTCFTTAIIFESAHIFSVFRSVWTLFRDTVQRHAPCIQSE